MDLNLPEPLDPLAADAPLIHLLSVRHNPLVAAMSEEQLLDLVQKLRQHATSAPTLSARIANDSEKVKVTRKPRVLTEEQRKRQSILDAI